MTTDDEALPFLQDLDAARLTRAGADGWPFGYLDRVRFGELDALGHVNNVAYLRWFETVRVRYLEAYGYFHGRESQSVVRHVSADYLAPIFGSPAVLLTGRTRLVKASSFVMEYGCFADGALCATGTAVVVSLGPDGRTRAPIADDIRRRMVDRDGAAEG